MSQQDVQNDVDNLITDWLRRANAAQNASDFPAAIAASQRAIALAQAEGLKEAEIRGYFEWARTLLLQGDLLDAYRKFEDIVTLARARATRHVEADALRGLGLACTYQSLYAEAERHLLQALQIYQDLGDQQGEGRAYHTLGENHLAQNNWRQAQIYEEKALSLCRESGDRMGERWILGNLGELCRIYGDYKGARVYYELSLETGRSLNDRRGASINLSNLAQVAHYLGDDPTALDYGQQARTIAEAIGDRRALGFALEVLGHALTGLQRWDEATAAYQRSLSIKNEIGELNHAMAPLAGLAHVAMLRGDADRALRYVEEILAYMTFEGALDGVDDVCHIYLVCYQVLRANADPRAQDILARGAHYLEEQAAHIADADMRRAYLEHIACHKEILTQFSIYNTEL